MNDDSPYVPVERELHRLNLALITAEKAAARLRANVVVDNGGTPVILPLPSSVLRGTDEAATRLDDLRTALAELTALISVGVTSPVR